MKHRCGNQDNQELMGVQMTEITLTDQYQTRQPGRTCGLKYSSISLRAEVTLISEMMKSFTCQL